MSGSAPATAAKPDAVDAAQQDKRMNVVFFLVDNLGMGELSVYNAGPLRGSTP